MNRKIELLLTFGTIIFASGFAPLLIVNFQMPSQTYKATTLDGVQITFDITMKTGTSMNAPIAILIHGFSGNREMMKMIAFSLADKGFICASLDLRGHGDSEGVMANSGFGNDVNAVIQFLQTKSIGNTSRIVLVGHSMGGGVALNLGAELNSSVVATIGVAPYAPPSYVNATNPRNLLLIISTGDAIIDADTVKQAFYRSINATSGDPFHVYSPRGTNRELFIVQGPDHLSIIYNAVVIDQIVRWATSNVFGAEQPIGINIDLLNVSVYVSLIGGSMMIIFALALVPDKLWKEKRGKETPEDTDWKGLAKTGLLAFALAGILGSLVSMAIAVLLMIALPLLFTNFVAAAFLGNSVIFGYFAERKLKSAKKVFSYIRFVKESIKKPSFKVDVSMGLIAAVAFTVLVYIVYGSNSALTFSTASIRVLALPIFILIYLLTFIFYESFFKGVARPMMGDGPIRIVLSAVYELIVLFSAILLEVFILTTVLGLVIHMSNFAFVSLGLGLFLIPITISVATAELFFEKTGGWIAQLIVSAFIFASMSLVFSPVLSFF